MQKQILVATLWITGLWLVTALVAEAENDSQHEQLPDLEFTELLEVVAIGVQLEKQSLLLREPSLKYIYRDAETSFKNILEENLFNPDQVFGRLQNDLGNHHGREYSLFLQSFWDVMLLYQEFYRLNADLFEAGVRTPFHAFLEAIHQGLQEDSTREILIAGDGGKVNPLNMIRSQELVFTSW